MPAAFLMTQPLLLALGPHPQRELTLSRMRTHAAGRRRSPLFTGAGAPQAPQRGCRVGDPALSGELTLSPMRTHAAGRRRSPLYWRWGPTGTPTRLPRWGPRHPQRELTLMQRRRLCLADAAAWPQALHYLLALGPYRHPNAAAALGTPPPPARTDADAAAPALLGRRRCMAAGAALFTGAGALPAPQRGCRVGDPATPSVN